MANENSGRLFAVVGMQYGSEGKGAIASYLAPVMSMGVRVGAANAGHTIYFRGQKFVMQQIPSAWVNPFAKLVIGAGALISLNILLGEIKMVEHFLPLRGRLFIDHNAHIVLSDHVAREEKSDLKRRIGSTSATAREGIGEAAAAKVLRENSCRQAKDVPELAPYCADTATLINETLDHGHYVLLEGTQGFGLSIDHGVFPFVTSRNATVAALAEATGVNPGAFPLEVIGVVRSYPIRVAGNSGPFDADSEELNWEDVTHRAGAPHRIEERTSVTGNIRRVATFSLSGLKRAIAVNRPTELALTFADYLDWVVHGSDRLSPRVERFICTLEEETGISVGLVQTGPRTTIDLNWYRRSMLRKLSND